jgi:Ca2+-binding RTX toxin-like protein
MTSIWRDTYTLAVPESASTTNHRVALGDVLGIGNDRAVVAYRLNYTDFGNGAGSEGIYFRFVDPFGNDLAQEVFVASSTFNVISGAGTRQSPPEATLLSNGDVLVTWNESPQTASASAHLLRGRVFSADGFARSDSVTLLGGVGVDGVVTVEQTLSGFQVVSEKAIATGAEVTILNFSSTGIAVGSPVVFAATGSLAATGPTLGVDAAILTDGSTVVTWARDGNIYSQKIKIDGSLLGGITTLFNPAESQLLSISGGPTIEALNGGGFVLGYYGEDDTNRSMYKAVSRTFSNSLAQTNPEIVHGTVYPFSGGFYNGIEFNAGQAVGTYFTTFKPLNGYENQGGAFVTFTDINGSSQSITGLSGSRNQGGLPTASSVLSDGRLITVASVGNAYPATDNRGTLQAFISDTRTTPINGTPTADVLVGRTGANAMANDIMWGFGGNDSLYGMLGNDILDGGSGDDVVSGNEGNDVLVLGDGNDYAYVGTNTVQDYAYGGNGNDVLVGDVGAVDILLGDAGNDTIYGGAGAVNYMFSGTGDNVMVGGATQVDVFYAEGTNDIIQAATAQSLTYRLAAGTSVLTGGTGVDQFIGGTFASNDTVDGGAGADYLYGGNGNDLLSGGAGNDVILGQAGNDTLEGGAGVNLLWANDAGSDQILVNVANGGTQVVDFFEAGGTNDVVRLLGSSLTSFAGYEALLANIGNAIGGNLLLNTGTGAQLYLNLGANQTAIWFQGVSAYSLTSADFLFA